MVGSNQCHLKTIKVSLFALLLPFLHIHSANAIPTAEDINSLAEKAHQTTGIFMQKSFQIRMAYEYSGEFLSNRDREELMSLAKSGGDQLLSIAEEQRNTKKQIEDYQGDDWDKRYGATGLWRKLATDLHITNQYKYRIDYYLALTSAESQRNVIFQQILTHLNSSNTVYISAESQLLRANIYWLLSLTQPKYKTSAQKDFASLRMRSDMKDSTVFQTAIERIRLFGPTSPDQLKTLAEEIAKSKCKDDIELVLSLAFLQLKYEPESLTKTLEIRPQIEDFLGSLILSDLSHRIDNQQHAIQYFEQVSIFEAELAVMAAWKNTTKEYKNLLSCLSGIGKFQTPVILYVTASALADSSPSDAVKLLIKASKLQSAIEGQKNNRLSIKSHDIASQAAELAYSVYSNDTANCRVAVEAFENYHTMPDEQLDEKLEYLYTVVLRSCGQVEKSKILLDEIASRNGGIWRNRAKLDLIITATGQYESDNPEKINLILQQLDNFIKEPGLRKNEKKLRAEAIKIYCELIFQSKQLASAKKVMGLLTDPDIAVDPNLNILKAKAQRQLGKPDKAAESLCKVVYSSSEKYAEAIQLLSEFIDKLDYYQVQIEDFPKMTRDCFKLAFYCWDHANSENIGREALILVEISTYLPTTDLSKSSDIRELINKISKYDDNKDTDLLRCRARLLSAQGEFAEAARLWAQLAKMLKQEFQQTNQQGWKWWRAKFYELDCFAKTPQTDYRGIIHTIEVMENTYTDIPPLWAEKLNLLKIHCRQIK